MYNYFKYNYIVIFKIIKSSFFMYNTYFAHFLLTPYISININYIVVKMNL